MNLADQVERLEKQKECLESCLKSIFATVYHPLNADGTMAQFKDKQLKYMIKPLKEVGIEGMDIFV